MPVGFTLPYQITSGSIGYFRMTEDKFDAITNDIRSILITNWGERVMHYDFGCNFREFLFEPIRSDELKQHMADRVLSQMEKWMPFVIVDELNIVLSEDDPAIRENEIRVSISFMLTSLPDLKKKTSFLIVT